MAGRIRTIKPELMEDAITAGLSHAAFRLFVGMIVLADDHGNLRASPKWLEGQVFHGRDIEHCGACCLSMTDLVGELGAKLVTFYDVDGQQYAHLNGWSRHQRIDNASEPRVPLHPGWGWKHETYNDGKRTRTRVVLFPIASSDAAATLASPDLPSDAAAATPGCQALPPRQSLAGSDLSGGAAAASNVTSDLPSVATAGSRSPITIPKGGDPDAAASPPQAPTLKPDGAEVRRELAKADDLWPDSPDLDRAAMRIADNVSDPMNRAKGEHVAVTREAVAYARTQKGKFDLATAATLLGKAEEKVGWILEQYRTGRRQKAGMVAADKIGSHTVTEDFHDHEAREMERTAREAERRKDEAAPAPTAEERARMLADLKARIGSGGRAA